MADYTFDSELVADPFTFQRAANSAITIYDVADENNTAPLALKDLNGLPLPNPLTSNVDAFVPAFVAPSAQVKMVGGGLEVVRASFQGVRDVAVAAAGSAESAAADAAEAALLAQAPTDAQVDAGLARADIPGQVSAVVPPLLDAQVPALVPPLVAQAIANDPTVADSAAAIAQSTAGLIPKWKANTSYTSGQQVVAPTGDVVSAKVTFMSGAVYSESNWNKSDSAKKVERAGFGEAPDSAGYTHVLTDSDGRVAFGVKDDASLEGIGIGQPTSLAEGYSFSVRDAENRVGELAQDLAGKVPDWVLERWEQRRGWNTAPELLDAVTPADAWRRTILVDEFKRRRGGVIGTDGKAVVSLRFDHGLNNFASIVVPLLRKYSLPALQAMNAREINSTLNGPRDWAECIGWWANDGIEFSNHTATHDSAGTAGTPEGRANAYDEIVNGLAELKANLGNQFQPEIFTPAGGVTVGEKALFDGGKTSEAFWNTYYGQLVMQHHPATHGYVGGSMLPLPQDMGIGQTIIGMDSNTAAGLKASVDDAVRFGAAVQFMGHPSEINKAGGYITTEQYEEFFAYVAQLRDQGKLEVLTATGLLLADPTSKHRHNFLAPYGWASGMGDWGGTTGWSTTAGPDGKQWATTTTGTQLSRTIAMSTMFKHFRGGNRQLAYEVIAPAGAVVETTITGSSGVISRTKQHTLEPSSSPVTVRQHCALPLVASPNITVKIGRVSGGQVTISDPRFITV
ncbi:tail protein [Arthrobacter phage Kumotta]|uniref:LysinA, hydrolase domain n=2 Tax=Kumottavirus TaxID=3044749 RepID=A0A4Y6EN94_9CAUD|nr:tail protein [Arthrobacter phage Kumotta]YP_010649507.1 tail protein [Arthrobacter phage MargaretKali]AXH44405.1 lysin A [Arthrobacter phage MargaretKali]QDF19535.1 lysinA, hydrolase domain [Arthrobacter phage Kumotta]